MEARLWLASCAPALDSRWAEQQASLFSASEQARLARISRLQRRAQFVAGHVLAQQLLQCALGHAVAVEVAGDGRPLLVDAEPWTLSLSHSGAWVAALLAEGAAGVDIELDRPLRNAAELLTWLEGMKNNPQDQTQDEPRNATATKCATAGVSPGATTGATAGAMAPATASETAHGTLREWALAEARLKAGVAAPAIYARWGVAKPSNWRGQVEDESATEDETLWLAVAGVLNLRHACIADLAACSYNDCSIAWSRVAE